MPPYVSQAARDRVRFLDVGEARGEICAEDGCSPAEAEGQIRSMLADGVIKEPLWADTGEPAPGKGRHWLDVYIDADTGKALDAFAWDAWNAIWGPGGPRYDDASRYAPLEPAAEWRILLLDKVSFRAARGTRQPSEAIGKTGTAGRPTKSWHLIEAECRRRYSKGERHANGAIESPARWSGVLLSWLQEAHPEAPQPKSKTTANKLSKLLRELQQGGA